MDGGGANVGGAADVTDAFAASMSDNSSNGAVNTSATLARSYPARRTSTGGRTVRVKTSSSPSRSIRVSPGAPSSTSMSTSCTRADAAGGRCMRTARRTPWRARSTSSNAWRPPISIGFVTPASASTSISEDVSFAKAEPIAADPRGAHIFGPSDHVERSDRQVLLRRLGCRR